MAEEQDIIKKPGLLKQLIFTGQLHRLIIYLAASLPASVLFIMGLLALSGTLKPITFGDIIIGLWYDYIILGIIVFTGVYGIYEFMRLQTVRKIDDRFPDFVRDLAEARRAGMTFTKAIMHASKGNYGVLTPEIQKIARQISWGSSVDAALSSFAKRVNTKLIHRTISLIIEASRSGGHVADVLDAASKDAREIKLIESERRASLISYVAIVYVGMGVFLMIVVIITKTLLPALMGSSGGSSLPAGGMNVLQNTKEDILAITQVFFSAAIIQSGLMGLVAGVFEEGDLISGIKHSFIMLIIAWVVFKFFVTGV